MVKCIKKEECFILIEGPAERRLKCYKIELQRQENFKTLTGITQIIEHHNDRIFVKNCTSKQIYKYTFIVLVLNTRKSFQFISYSLLILLNSLVTNQLFKRLYL